MLSDKADSRNVDTGQQRVQGSGRAPCSMRNCSTSPSSSGGTRPRRLNQPNRRQVAASWYAALFSGGSSSTPLLLASVSGAAKSGSESQRFAGLSKTLLANPRSVTGAMMGHKGLYDVLHRCIFGETVCVRGSTGAKDSEPAAPSDVRGPL